MYRVGDHILWDPPFPGHLIQVSQEISIGGGRRLARGGQQPLESMAEVGAADSAVDQGGCGFLYLGTDLPFGGSVGYIVWVRDMGDDSVHQEGVGGITPHSDP